MNTNTVYVFLPRELLSGMCHASVRELEKSARAELIAPVVEKAAPATPPAWTWFMDNPRPQAR